MEVLSSNSLYIDYDPKTGLMKIKRIDVNSNEEYKESVYLLAGIIEKYVPQKIIVDTKEFTFPIPPDIQEWSRNLLTRLLLRLGVKKVAYVMSQDFIARLALQQILDEAKRMGLDIFYTSLTEEATEWILKD